MCAAYEVTFVQEERLLKTVSNIMGSQICTCTGQTDFEKILNFTNPDWETEITLVLLDCIGTFVKKTNI